jgi:hypothetical protein
MTPALSEPMGGFTPGWSGTDLNHKVVRGPWQNRDKTLRVGPRLGCLRAKSRFPKLLKTLKVEENPEKLGKRSWCL